MTLGTAQNVNETKRVHSDEAKSYDELTNRTNDCGTQITRLSASRDAAIAGNDAEIEARAEALADGVRRADKPMADIAELDAKVAVAKALLGKLQAKLPVRKALRDKAKSALDRANEAHVRAVTRGYFEPNSHLLDWSKVAEMPLREVIAILCAKGPPDGDPRIAIRISVGKIRDADWLGIKKRVAVMLGTSEVPGHE